MRRPRVSTLISNMPLIFLLESMRTLFFFSWNCTKYRIQGNYCIFFGPTSSSILALVIDTEVAKTATPFWIIFGFGAAPGQMTFFAIVLASDLTFFSFLSQYFTSLVWCLLR